MAMTEKFSDYSVLNAVLTGNYESGKKLMTALCADTETKTLFNAANIGGKFLISGLNSAIVGARMKRHYYELIAIAVEVGGISELLSPANTASADFLKNEKVVDVILNNATHFSTVLSNSSMRSSLFNGSYFKTKILTNTTRLNTILADATYAAAYMGISANATAVAGNGTAMARVMVYSTSRNVVLTNTTARNALFASTAAATAMRGSADFMTELAANQTAMSYFSASVSSDVKVVFAGSETACAALRASEYMLTATSSARTYTLSGTRLILNIEVNAFFNYSVTFYTKTLTSIGTLVGGVALPATLATGTTSTSSTSSLCYNNSTARCVYTDLTLAASENLFLSNGITIKYL